MKTRSKELIKWRYISINSQSIQIIEIKCTNLVSGRHSKDPITSRWMNSDNLIFRLIDNVVVLGFIFMGFFVSVFWAAADEEIWGVGFI